MLQAAQWQGGEVSVIGPGLSLRALTRNLTFCFLKARAMLQQEATTTGCKYSSSARRARQAAHRRYFETLDFRCFLNLSDGSRSFTWRGPLVMELNKERICYDLDTAEAHLGYMCFRTGDKALSYHVFCAISSPTGLFIYWVYDVHVVFGRRFTRHVYVL